MASKDFIIRYDEFNNMIIRKVINEYIDFNDPTIFTSTIEEINQLIQEHNCKRIMSDFSLTGVRMSFEFEFYFAKNFKKIFNYPDDTYIAIYDGEFYTEKKWSYLKHVFNENNVKNLEVFGEYDEALAWLKSH